MQLEGLRAAVLAGYRALIGNQGPVHAVAATVAVMEDHWAFNAGYGSVLNEVTGDYIAVATWMEKGFCSLFII